MRAMPPVTFAGDRLAVHFDRFDAAAYQRFLQVKALPELEVVFDRETEAYTVTAPKRFASLLGVQPPVNAADELPLAEWLFDDQQYIVRTALDAKRYAVWSDCGLGKTLVALEFARHVIHRTGGRVMIVTLNEIVEQFMEECRRWYGDCLPIERLRTRKEMREWCAEPLAPVSWTGADDVGLAITNYEKFNPEDGDNDNQVIPELRHLAGLVLDESSRLKTGGGKQKWAIIKSSKGIEYKLSCTATPAPNDTMEFASQASFLERMRSGGGTGGDAAGDIIWTYFQRNSKTHRWEVKRHAREAFFRFMSSWSIYVRDPRRYGWRQDHQPVPEPIVTVHEIAATPEQLAEMRDLIREANGQRLLYERDTNAIERVKLSEVAKGFLYEGPAGDGARKAVRRIPSRKPGIVADLVTGEWADGQHVLVWTQFDAESDILAELLAERGVPFDVVTGSVPKKDRGPILERFRKGESQVLIGRPRMLGYGQNFQVCGAMVFSGWNDSFEEWYQAIRRAYRFGQTQRLRVHVPVIRELEGDMLENIQGKEAKHLSAIEEMETNYIAALKRAGGVNV